MQKKLGRHLEPIWRKGQNNMMLTEGITDRMVDGITDGWSIYKTNLLSPLRAVKVNKTVSESRCNGSFSSPKNYTFDSRFDDFPFIEYQKIS